MSFDEFSVIAEYITWYVTSFNSTGINVSGVIVPNKFKSPIVLPVNAIICFLFYKYFKVLRLS